MKSGFQNIINKKFLKMIFKFLWLKYSDFNNEDGIKIKDILYKKHMKE